MTARGAVSRQREWGLPAVILAAGGNPEEQRQPPVGHLHNKMVRRSPSFLTLHLTILAFFIGGALSILDGTKVTSPEYDSLQGGVTFAIVTSILLGAWHLANKDN